MDRREAALLLLGIIALVRSLAWGPDETGPPMCHAARVGTPIPLVLGQLAGPEFRLLPGVGPVLAGRLEAARVAGGGQLDESLALSVPGVGPGLLTRWDAAGVR